MSWFQHHRYLYVCLDPVHVGAGGYRLGRVDNAIVREPGTNLPKVPGTSLSGAARSYAAMAYGRPEAAGQQARLTGDAKDPKTCPILYTFGTASDDTEGLGSRAGAANLSDALVFLFPVSTTEGPRWVTTLEMLDQAGVTATGAKPTDEGSIICTWKQPPAQINAGWLLLSVGGEAVLSAPSYLALSEIWKEVANRILIVTPRYLSVVANSNLEVRTSVSIDPFTGAAAEHLLFTYEAIPRATWLIADVVIDDFAAGQSKRPFPCLQKHGNGAALPRPWAGPADVVKTGLELIEYLGVGGMGTRGFGRMKVVADRVVPAGDRS